MINEGVNKLWLVLLGIIASIGAVGVFSIPALYILKALS